MAVFFSSRLWCGATSCRIPKFSFHDVPPKRFENYWYVKMYGERAKIRFWCSAQLTLMVGLHVKVRKRRQKKKIYANLHALRFSQDFLKGPQNRLKCNLKIFIRRTLTSNLLFENLYVHSKPWTHLWEHQNDCKRLNLWSLKVLVNPFLIMRTHWKLIFLSCWRSTTNFIPWNGTNKFFIWSSSILTFLGRIRKTKSA